MMNWLTKRQREPSRQQWPLDMTLASLSPHDRWTLADAVTGTIAFGSTGSGKSTGAGRFLLKAMLRNRFGGLCLCVKAEDRSDIERYAAECGRSDDLVIFAPDAPHRFNLLQHELNHGGGSAVSRLENAVDLFRVVLEIAERGRPGHSGSGDNQYFHRAALQLLRSALFVLVVANEPVTPENIHRFIMAAPRSIEESRDSGWREYSYCYQTLCRADDQPMTASVERDFELTLLYWMQEFASMDGKPRSSVISTYTTMVDMFQRGVIRDCFFDTTNITPDACREGKIIVLDFPTLQWNETGRIVQAAFKYTWQRSQERCSAAMKTRPVFLISDEAQQFITSRDAAFQATARSSRVCTVYLTQNLPGLTEAVGGEDGRHAIDALLGNLRLKIFHAQDDVTTCNYQSESTGKTKRYLFNSSTQAPTEQTFDFFHPRRNHSAGMSESWEYEIQPWEWSRNFRCGGAGNDFLVDAVAYQGGRVWQATQKTYLPITFKQC